MGKKVEKAEQKVITEQENTNIEEIKKQEDEITDTIEIKSNITDDITKKYENEIQELTFCANLLKEENEELKNKIKNLELEKELSTQNTLIEAATALGHAKPLYKIGDDVMYISKFQKMKLKVSAYQGYSQQEGHLYRISNHEFKIFVNLVPEKYLSKDINKGFNNEPQSLNFI